MRPRRATAGLLAALLLAIHWSPSILCPPTPLPPPLLPEWKAPDPARLSLRSACAVVVDESAGRELFAKEPDRVTPIASLTKLMTAMVTLDADLPLGEPVQIEPEDVDTLRNSLSHLPVGWVLTRGDALLLALMCSENRAAHALARTYPGGRLAFVEAMNRKAAALGMAATRFADSSGLDGADVSTARDVARMASQAGRYAVIRQTTTTADHALQPMWPVAIRLFGNSDPLVRNPSWTIGVSKTGYILDSGYCLVLQATLAGRPILIVLLNGPAEQTRVADAERVRQWLAGG